MIFSSWLDGKPELWTLDPSGAAFGYRGAAAGKAKNNARTEIEKLDFETLTVQEGLKQAARIIHSVHDEVKGMVMNSESLLFEESLTVKATNMYIQTADSNWNYLGLQKTAKSMVEFRWILQRQLRRLQKQN